MTRHRRDENSPPRLDEVDRGIIAALRKDGRASWSAIAAELGMTEGAIRLRVKRLMESGVLQVGGRVNPEVLEDHQVAWVGIKVKESGTLEECARLVAGLPEVLSVAIASGRYDLIAEILIPSNHGLIRFLAESLSGVAGLQSTETFLMLKTYNKWV